MNTISKLKARMKIQCLSLIFITCTLIILFSVVGCSDTYTPYTGSMPTSVDVSDFTTSNTGGLYCIYNDSDSSCIDLIPLISTGSVGEGPIVHIYPERTLYLFYYEGKPIVRAERVGDTTDIIRTLNEDRDLPPKQPLPPKDTDNNPNDINDNDDDNNNNNGDDDNNNGDDDDNNNNGDDNNNNGDDNNNNGDDPNSDDEDDTPDNVNPTNNGNDGHGWLIWIYYPEGTVPLDTPTLSKSEVTVTINGRQLADEDITGFAQFIDANGEMGIQFFYPTESAELLDLNVQMIGITDRDGTVKFNINYLWRSN